jgi:hypothetical protein
VNSKFIALYDGIWKAPTNLENWAHIGTVLFLWGKNIYIYIYFFCESAKFFKAS